MCRPPKQTDMSGLLLMVVMGLTVTLPVCRETDHSLPVCREFEEPVACHNTPCYLPPGPHRAEIQVSQKTDGNHCLLTRGVEKARGSSVWNIWVARSDDQLRRVSMYSIDKLMQNWPS